MNQRPTRVTSNQVVAAYSGDQHALRLMPTALRDPDGRMDIDGELPDITVTREAALIVLRRLHRDPSSRMEAFLWSEMARLGTDFFFRKVVEVEIEFDPDYHEELCEVVHSLDYLDDGPLPEGHVESLIKMLEGPPAQGSQ
jgi:hypothetical protein